MALFVIGDLHLALSVSNKKMDIFGGWENYMELLEKNWNENISSEDTVVLAGDSSWGFLLDRKNARKENPFKRKS